NASAADTVPIEAGPFIYGGPGEPRSSHYGEPDYTQPELSVDLPAFAIDRTELSNAHYKPFGDLASVSGYPAPVYGVEELRPHESDPEYPVTYLAASEAAAYCVYMGKQLPSEYQWTKAARGGVSIHGAPNPYPRRLFPWGIVDRPACANLKGPED